MPPENLERHHQRIAEQVRVNGGVENVNAAVIARRSHERVVPVELRRPHRLFVSLVRYLSVKARSTNTKHKREARKKYHGSFEAKGGGGGYRREGSEAGQRGAS